MHNSIPVVSLFRQSISSCATYNPVAFTSRIEIQFSTMTTCSESNSLFTAIRLARFAYFKLWLSSSSGAGEIQEQIKPQATSSALKTRGDLN